jgi:hypothetical protein
VLLVDRDRSHIAGLRRGCPRARSPARFNPECAQRPSWYGSALPRLPLSDRGSGSGAEYNIIGWVGFVPTAFRPSGSSGTIEGYFTQVIWQGLTVDTGSVPDFGVRVITLVE